MYTRLGNILVCSLIGAGLFGQSVADSSITKDPSIVKIDAILKSMTATGASRAVLSEPLTDVILAAARRDHAPSRGSVAAFTEVLSGALPGQKPTLLSGLSQAVLEILNPSGATFVKATHLETRLKVIGLDQARIQTVVSRYVKIGEQVRGPDDSPVSKFPVLRPFK